MGDQDDIYNSTSGLLGGDKEKVDDRKFIFRQAFTLENEDLHDFEILISTLKAAELIHQEAEDKTASSENFQNNHHVTLSIRQFETGDQAIFDQFKAKKNSLTIDEIKSLGFYEITDLKNHRNELIINGKMQKSLQYGRECELSTLDSDKVNHILCFNLEILSDSRDNRMQFQVIQIEVDHYQRDQKVKRHDIEVQALTFQIQYRSLRFEKIFNSIKLCFVAGSVVQLLTFSKKLKQYNRSDLGSIQKWI
mmetsp:Transcript_16109/g.27221  ORF Transcript_16109/g.27221 Transcript_16109/m.27221 type:complete len:250 (+) Transcript_16109:220-969(+)